MAAIYPAGAVCTTPILRSSGCLGGQRKKEGSTSILLGDEIKPALVSLENLLADIKSTPGASLGVGCRRIPLEKPGEQLVAVGFGNHFAKVVHAHYRCVDRRRQ